MPETVCRSSYYASSRVGVTNLLDKSCESSSIASYHTNGLYPIRDLKVVKTSGNNKNLFLAPQMELLADKYQLAWDVPTRDLIEVYACVQKFTGQGISADFYKKYDSEDRKVGTKEMIQNYLLMKKYGLKTAYYLNFITRAAGEEKVYEEEAPDCDSCSL